MRENSHIDIHSSHIAQVLVSYRVLYGGCGTRSSPYRKPIWGSLIMSAIDWDVFIYSLVIIGNCHNGISIQGLLVMIRVMSIKIWNHPIHIIQDLTLPSKQTVKQVMDWDVFIYLLVIMSNCYYKDFSSWQLDLHLLRSEIICIPHVPPLIWEGLFQVFDYLRSYSI